MTLPPKSHSRRSYGDSAAQVVEGLYDEPGTVRQTRTDMPRIIDKAFRVHDPGTGAT